MENMDMDITCAVENCELPAEHGGYCDTHYNRKRRGMDLNKPIKTRLRGATIEQRLRAYAPAGEPTQCWEWTRGTNKGYGVMGINGKMRASHIVAWELHTGLQLPAGMIVRHTCDNPLCTNPAHLLLGTHAENVADKVGRGRQSKGTTHGLTKNTADDVREIRALCANGERQSDVARRFGLSQTSISNIVRGKTWGHI